MCAELLPGCGPGGEKKTEVKGMVSSGIQGHQYGLSTGLTVSRDENDPNLMLGGVDQRDHPWSHTLTQRAAVPGTVRHGHGPGDDSAAARALQS